MFPFIQTSLSLSQRIVGRGKRDVSLLAFLFRCLSLCLFPVFASSGASLEAPVKEDALKIHCEH